MGVTMVEQKNVPALRFPEFTGDWEQRKLGETKTYFTDGNYGESYPSSQDMSDKENGVPFLRGSDFSNGYLDASNANYISKEKHAVLTSGHIENDDIILAVRGSLGTLGYATKANEGWNINSQLAILRTNKNELLGMFLIQYLLGSNGQKEILSRNTGTALKQLPINQLKDIPVPRPRIEEQKKIGAFFKQLDNTIALHQRKLDLLKEQKKGFLQKMFPKIGEKVPEIRFPEFTDNWEQRELGDMGDTLTGLSGKTKEDFGHGNAHFVTYLNVFGNPIADPTGIESVEIDDKQKQVQYGDVFFTTSSETPEDVGMSSIWLEKTENVYLNSFCFGYRPTVEFEPYYLAFMLRSPSIRKKFMLLAQGISRYNISKNKTMEIDVPVPEIEEQKKIGSFFKQLNDTITLHQRKLDLLKDQKKAFLQQMFI